jgi:hypothetical protein
MKEEDVTVNGWLLSYVSSSLYLKFRAASFSERVLRIPCQFVSTASLGVTDNVFAGDCNKPMMSLDNLVLD